MSDKTRQSVLSYNKFLRESAQENKDLTICTQSQSEQELVLETIQTFVAHMNSGKARKVCLMKISLQFVDTERTQC